MIVIRRRYQGTDFKSVPFIPLALGGVFFGESMFSRLPNSSKIALVSLVQRLQEWDFDLIDCQMRTAHLMQFGAREIPGREFQKILVERMLRQTKSGKWDIAW